MNKLSGLIYFDNVEFKNVRICGSVINNYDYDSSGNLIIDNDLTSLSSNDQNYYNTIIGKLNCVNNYEIDSLNNCFRIEVKNSRINNFEANRQYTTYFTVYQFNMIPNFIYAGFLNIKNFFGDVIFDNNVFSNNFLQTNCALTPVSPRSLIYLENVKNIAVTNCSFSTNMGSISAIMNVVLNWKFSHIPSNF